MRLILVEGQLPRSPRSTSTRRPTFHARDIVQSIMILSFYLSRLVILSPVCISSVYFSVIRLFSGLDLRGVIGSVIKEAKPTFQNSGYWDEAFYGF